MQGEAYSVPLFVNDYECDVNGMMLPGSILRRAQQISTDQCAKHGLTTEVYRRTHTAFLLAKIALTVHRPIAAGTQGTLTTRPYEPFRAVFRRITELCDEQGRLLAEADARWILVDTDTKRILRNYPPEMNLPFFEQTEKSPDLRIEKPDDTRLLGTERADYLRCDTNRHMNNTVYADIICNRLPKSDRERVVRQMTLLYHREVPLDGEFQLRMGGSAQQGYYFMGQSAQGTHFEAEAHLFSAVPSL